MRRLPWAGITVVSPTFLRADFSFMPGAAAIICTPSAPAHWDPQANWVGPLLSRGAACSLSAMPNRSRRTPRLDRLADALLAGRTFGGKRLRGLALAVWQIAVVGDPLYALPVFALDEQVDTPGKRPPAELP